MSTKNERQKMIREIINKKKISRQEDLLLLLVNSGFDLTQATLSRDLRELKVGKIHDIHLGSIYFIPEDKATPMLNGVLEIATSGNLAILKTQAGFANSVAVQIDNAKIEGVIGTIAGNDSILIVFEDDIPKESFKYILGNQFPEIAILLKS
jgi:transcriptional regulator of arginine metabolism